MSGDPNVCQYAYDCRGCSCRQQIQQRAGNCFAWCDLDNGTFCEKAYDCQGCAQCGRLLPVSEHVIPKPLWCQDLAGRKDARVLTPPQWCQSMTKDTCPHFYVRAKLGDKPAETIPCVWRVEQHMCLDADDCFSTPQLARAYLRTVPNVARTGALNATNLAADYSCYVDRYTDLLRGYCAGEKSKCDWVQVHLHWVSSGMGAGRIKDCTTQPTPPPPSLSPHQPLPPWAPISKWSPRPPPNPPLLPPSPPAPPASPPPPPPLQRWRFNEDDYGVDWNPAGVPRPCALTGHLASRNDTRTVRPGALCEDLGLSQRWCNKYYTSFGIGTAQLCEWHGRCLSGTVVPCHVDAPLLPPPPSSPPKSLRARAEELAAATLGGKEGSIDAAKELAKELAKLLKTDVQGNLDALAGVTEEVASQAGLPPIVVVLVVLLGGIFPVLLLGCAAVYCVVSTGRRVRRERAERRAGLAEAATKKLRLDRALDAVRQKRHRPGGGKGHSAAYAALDDAVERPEV